MLDVGRVVTGKIKLEQEAFDLGAAVQFAVSVLSGGGRFKSHVLHTDIASVPVLADRVRIEQIVENLVGNALKYTPTGGWIRISVGSDGDSALLEVADSGVGMPQELCAHAFDLFFQGEGKLESSHGGLGLGLSLVRRLAELHGGTAEAFSEGPGHGSRFQVRLPLRPALEARPPAPPKTAPRGARRILIVEDNADAREMLRDLLALAGHEVSEAESGPEGVESALRLQPDFTLIDIGLPGFDGYEVAQRIRRAPEGAGLALIALTGYGSGEDRSRALQAGFDRHLTKPIDMDELDRLLAGDTRRSGTTPVP